MSNFPEPKPVLNLAELIEKFKGAASADPVSDFHGETRDETGELTLIARVKGTERYISISRAGSDRSWLNTSFSTNFLAPFTDALGLRRFTDMPAPNSGTTFIRDEGEGDNARVVLEMIQYVTSKR